MGMASLRREFLEWTVKSFLRPQCAAFSMSADLNRA
jgi:hypothetical protein